MHHMLNIAFSAARKAGTVINRAFDRLDLIKIDEKSRHDYVTNIDKQSEEILIDLIHQAYPDHGILAEESGEQLGNEFLWIIDPLDGTNNFVHGFPHFAISIGLQIKGVLEHGLIYDPLRDELFTASRGAGAYLNKRRCRVSQRSSLESAFIATGTPFRDEHNLEIYINMLKACYPKVAGMRRAGSAALDLAYVAAGRLDGFWEMGLRPWDIAAGALIVQESGGLVGTFKGDPDFLNSKEIIAGNPKLFKSLVQTIHSFV